MKRLNTITNNNSQNTKQLKLTTNNITINNSNYLLENKIYFTKVEKLTDIANKNALSLQELINKINPISSIHFNYLVDPEFVINQYPQKCQKFPMTIVVGQPHGASLRAECAKFLNITVKTASIPFPYGTHHSKLSLFESNDAVHVMISTANLIFEDYNLKTQCFYYCRAPFVNEILPLTSTKNIPNQNTVDYLANFGKELVEYLQEAYAKNDPKSYVNYWIDKIIKNNADFREIKDRIISSLPGRFVESKLYNYGHMKLRKLLSEIYDPEELKKQKTKICQFSSIGSLGKKEETWLCDEFLKSLCGGDTINMDSQNLKLIYPSVENVRCSLEGYNAGNSLPYTMLTHSKQKYLRNFLHQWKSDFLMRTAAMPHVKSYTALDQESNKPTWLLITSANLSQAAWGRLEKRNSQLFCRSYELGVLICSKNFLEVENKLPLPYDLPLKKYESNDEPFLVDVQNFKPDSMGKFSAFDYLLN